MPHRAIRLTLAALVAVVLSWPASANAATRTVSVGNNVFSPSSVTVNRGDTVRWVWRSRGRAHNVTSRSFADSGNRTRGSFSVRFNRAGRYPYVCTLHRGMRGTVNVRR